MLENPSRRRARGIDLTQTHLRQVVLSEQRMRGSKQLKICKGLGDGEGNTKVGPGSGGLDRRGSFTNCLVTVNDTIRTRRRRFVQVTTDPEGTFAKHGRTAGQ